MLADAMSIRTDEVAAMIRNGLTVYKIGTRRRVFVRDAIRHAKRTWRTVK
jgi:hypothetical protein